MKFYYMLYNWTFSGGDSFSNSFFCKAVRYMTECFANYFAMPLFVMKLYLSKSYENTNIPVSLTTFPARIDKVHLVIYSLLTQCLRPKKIYLWLACEQFPGGIESLPAKLLKLRKYGLEIVLVDEDLRSYKKFYHLLVQKGDCTFITVDDDILYHSEVIKELVDAHANNSNNVCAHRVLEIDTKNPYINWKLVKGVSRVSNGFMPTGCGGVLYPKSCFYKQLLNKTTFTSICKDADDIWLNVNSYLEGAKVRFVGSNRYLLNIRNANSKPLHEINVGEGNNDLVIKSVRKYFLEELGVDVFKRNG